MDDESLRYEETGHDESSAPPPTLAGQLHDIDSDTKIVVTAGLQLGGVSPVAGLAMGLAAAHQEGTVGQPAASSPHSRSLEAPSASSSA